MNQKQSINRQGYLQFNVNYTFSKNYPFIISTGIRLSYKLESCTKYQRMRGRGGHGKKPTVRKTYSTSSIHSHHHVVVHHQKTIVHLDSTQDCFCQGM